MYALSKCHWLVWLTEVKNLRGKKSTWEQGFVHQLIQVIVVLTCTTDDSRTRDVTPTPDLLATDCTPDNVTTTYCWCPYWALHESTIQTTAIDLINLAVLCDIFLVLDSVKFKKIFFHFQLQVDIQKPAKTRIIFLLYCVRMFLAIVASAHMSFPSIFAGASCWNRNYFTIVLLWAEFCIYFLNHFYFCWGKK